MEKARILWVANEIGAQLVINHNNIGSNTVCPNQLTIFHLPGALKLDGGKPKSYFATTAKLVKDLKLDETLVNVGYGPDNDPKLTGSTWTLVNKLAEHYGKKPRVKCERIDNNTGALSEIQFCYGMVSLLKMLFRKFSCL